MTISATGATPTVPVTHGKSKEVPPGLARRDLDLPPGIAKKLDNGGTLPAGIAKRFPAPAPETAPPAPSSEPTDTTTGTGATLDISV